VSDETNTNVVELTADIAAAYAAGNRLAASDLPTLIKSIHDALTTAATGVTAAPPESHKVPAVPIKRSVTPDFIICLEDGKQFKSLKRHLRTKYNQSPEDYRAKWGLAKDYPMVAPNYAASRSALAKSMGLGQKQPIRTRRRSAKAVPAEPAG